MGWSGGNEGQGKGLHVRTTIGTGDSVVHSKGGWEGGGGGGGGRQSTTRARLGLGMGYTREAAGAEAGQGKGVEGAEALGKGWLWRECD